MTTSGNASPSKTLAGPGLGGETPTRPPHRRGGAPAAVRRPRPRTSQPVERRAPRVRPTGGRRGRPGRCRRSPRTTRARSTTPTPSVRVRGRPATPTAARCWLQSTAGGGLSTSAGRPATPLPRLSRWAQEQWSSTAGSWRGSTPLPLPPPSRCPSPALARRRRPRRLAQVGSSLGRTPT